MAAVVIEVDQLCKRYSEFQAVDHLNLTIEQGEIFGLLGPNGAGKTTTILMLLGLTEPTSGQVQVVGYDPTRQPIAVKRRVGYLPDNVGFYEDMTGRQNLLYTAALNGIEKSLAEDKVEQLLYRVGLADVGDKRAGTYSRGMRQRLGLADVLIKDPQIMILDEPTLGIDPEGVRDLLQLIRDLSREEHMTVLLSSHQLHQVQEICDRVGIFVKGKMIAVGPIDELASQIMTGEPLEIECMADPLDSTLQDALRQIPEVIEIVPEKDIWLIRCVRGQREQKEWLGAISQTIMERGSRLLHFRIRNVDLDEIYRKYFEGGEGDE